MATKNIKYDKNDVAIVGIGCRFPDAENYNEFWDNLISGKNSIKEIDRWDIDKFFSTDLSKPNTTNSKWCGMIDNIDHFDNQFFNISPREAKNMDPQQRLLMEEAWHCIEDSAIPLSNLQESTTSVYIGVMATDYHQEASNDDVIIDSYAGLGNYNCILANRISYFFGFTGVSMAVDAACAASLVSIHQGRLSLMTRESDYVLAGGVTLNTHPWKYISFGKSRMFSPDGQCKTFDKDANGYVPGEGIAVVMMQRLEDAIRDGNHIYGLIKGSSVNHGGTTKSITAPRVEAQRDLILTAYKRSGFCPETVNYMEAHGTGTSLGDPIEVEALTKAFKDYIPLELGIDDFENNILKKIKKYEDKKIIEAIYVKYDREERYVLKDKSKETKNRLRKILKRIGFLNHRNEFCTIGSVKTNIGHLEAAAGIAGVIKVLMMLKHKKIPPILHLKTPNPIIKWENTPFVLAKKASDWKRMDKNIPLRAGVSSFGFGGVNSHALIEEFENPFEEEEKEHALNLFTLSAKSKPSFDKLVAEWKEFVKTPEFDSFSLESICTNLAAGRTSYPFRWGRKVSSKEDLVEKLHEIKEPYSAKAELEWCLRIGNFLWKGYNEILPIIEAIPSFKENLESLFEVLLFEVQMLDNIKDGYYEDVWDEKYVDLYSFITGHIYIQTIYSLGFSPQVITAEGQGTLLGLVLSGIIKLEDAVLYLSGEKEVGDILFKRPNIPYYDSLTKQTVMPFYFTEEYLQKLVKEVTGKNQLLGEILVDGAISEEEYKGEHQSRLGAILIRNSIITEDQLQSALELHKRTGRKLGDIVVEKKFCSREDLNEGLRQQDILHYYIDEVLHIDKAQLLSMSQFTFKRYLEEWDAVLSERGKVIGDMLHDKDLLARQEGKLPNEKLLLMVIIMSSLKQLYKKWNLADQKMADEKWFYEMIDLVVDGVIPKECIVELFLEVNPDYSKIIRKINTRQRHAKQNKSYVYIRELDKNIKDFGNISGWLEKARVSPGKLPEDEMAYMSMDTFSFLKLGEVSVAGVDGKKIIINMERDIFEAFKDSLLSLWLNGQIINWKKLNNNGIYKKIQLPLYPYNKKSFWLTKEAKKTPVTTERPAVTQKETAPVQQAICYKPAWIKDAGKKSGSDLEQKAVIIFKNEPGLSSALEEEARRYGSSFTVTPGSSFEKKSDIDFVINCGAEDDYKILLDALYEKIASGTPIDIYFLLTYEKENLPLKDIAGLENKIEKSIKSLFSLAKSLTLHGEKREVSLIAPVNKAYVVTKQDKAEGFVYGSVSGLMKTVIQENPRIKLKVVDLQDDTAGDKENVHFLLNESVLLDEDVMIASRNNERYVQKVEQEDIFNQKNKPVFKDGGVYVFVGGAGGIGQKMSHSICSQAKVTLFIVGRSPLNDKRQALLDELEKLGSHVYYLAADVTDYDQVEAMIEEVKTKAGSINGIIQSGGILEDKYLIQKEWDSFRRVMVSKVNGTWILNELTKKEPLDFFTVFSSIVSVVGNVGQVDYATANSFLDSFMHHRQVNDFPGKSISINWTLWADGGMGLSQSILDAFSKKSGVIYSKDGVEAFNRLIKGNVSQGIVIGNPAFFGNIGMLKGSKTGAPAAAALPVAKLSAEDTAKMVEKYLTDLVSEKLEIAVDDIDPEESFTAMGMESIMVQNVTAELDEKFDKISPTLLFEYPNLEKLVEYLKDKAKPGALAAAGPVEQPRGTGIVDVESYLTNLVSEKLEIAVDDIDPEESFTAMGMESIMVQNVTAELDEKFDKISPTLLFEYPNLEKLVEYLKDKAKPGALAAAGPVEQPQGAVTVDVESYLTNLVSEKLEIAVDDIDPEESFTAMGMESIMVQNVTAELDEKFDKISPTLLFEYPNLEKLVEYLKDKAKPGALASASPPMQDGAGVPAGHQPAGQALSDDQVIDLLEKMKRGEITVEEVERMTEEGV